MKTLILSLILLTSLFAQNNHIIIDSVQAEQVRGKWGRYSDDCVKFNNKCYESTINANVWSPAVFPSGWNEVSCE